MTDHKSVFRAYLDAFNNGDLDAFDKLVTDDYLNHDPLHPHTAPGPAGLKSVVAEMRAQAPQLHFEEVHLIVEHDLLVGHLLVHGFGEAPVRQIQVERFVGGRIAEHWRATGSGS
ncbi:ester cyclase [Streptomyces qinglanensis]|uniref:Predicted SnoaL-like aldol condensation-catalyzing enzyme n=1 Tax=Streptomyces qinglanensis TaxID=943816 RepID=A0A1H9RUB7_9ACTN|nr:nuclear transport factor 2 family protein [Streptomyces qinglanensis]SER76194.1 Predicted SnoaL-like aldol condensation-catalyzing enzyme [Streptomyces qinglanensis]